MAKMGKVLKADKVARALKGGGKAGKVSGTGGGKAGRPKRDKNAMKPMKASWE